MTGRQVPVKLEVNPVDLLLITAARTLENPCVGGKSFKAVYVLNPIAVKLIPTANGVV